MPPVLPRVEGGVCTVVVRGRSYLNTVVGTNRGAGSSPIKPEGRDVGTQRVLDQHGVSLAACLQTFDVMQASESLVNGAVAGYGSAVEETQWLVGPTVGWI